MKKQISLLLATLLLAGLGLQAFAADAEQSEAAESIDYTTGTPWPDIDLDGVVTEETEASLKDNFVLYVNKDAILNLEIPEGYPYGGTVMDTNLQLADDMKSLFLGEAPDNHDSLLAYNLFRLMMDWDSRNALGAEPLKQLVEAAEAIDSMEALRDYFLQFPEEDRFSALWSGGSFIDLADSTRHTLIISGCPLVLDDSAEYSGLTPYGAIKKDAYSELARKMLMKLGFTEQEALQKIDNCFAFEALLAPAILTAEEQGRPEYMERLNNHISLEELLKAQGGVPILEAFAAAGFPEEESYTVPNPDFLEKLNEVWTEENLALIRDYMIVHGVISAAGSLDRECYEWSCECSNAISGATGMLDDETAFSSAVSDLLEWPVARLYADVVLKPEDKDRITEMVYELLDAWRGILEEADFLSDETRASAMEKLEAIEPRVLYPDSWEKYECAELNYAGPEDGGTLWEALRSITHYKNDEAVREYPEPVDREKWAVTPQVMNCFYNPQDNSVTLCGAFAQGDIYNSGMSDEELLGKLGGVIGHEISHAFDSSGAQFDSEGNMASWWTEEDYAEFQEKNAKMEAYYNAMHPWEGQDFYGSMMTGEACADMGGIKAALRIAAEREVFDYDAFFRAFADLWLTKDSLQMAYRRINDSHPMAYLRINASLQQFDEFLDFYGITEGDGMYLAPEDRVAIW